MAGAVLCGGASRRMGRDKALVEYLGVPMAARVAAALRGAGCTPLVAVGGDPSALAALGLETVADGWPGEGPLGGVVTALHHFAGAGVVVVVACDLPLLQPATVAALVTALRARPEAMAAAALTDRVQPLCVAWRPAASPLLVAALDGGTRRLADVLARLPVVEVAVNRQDLRNVNAPSDLRQ